MVLRPHGLILTPGRHRPKLDINTHAATTWHRTSATFGLDQIPTRFRASLDPPRLHPTAQGRRRAFLYFNSVYPIRMGKWDLRFLVAKVEEDKLLNQLKQLVPKDSMFDLTVDGVYPRAKDGGAFVEFSFKAPTLPYTESSTVDHAANDESDNLKHNQLKHEQQALLTIEKETSTMLETVNFKPWYIFNWGKSSAKLVQGKPWNEDMMRYPYNTIKIEFASGPDLSQEQLYELFRPYGRIHNIEPQPASNKDLPRFANITFVSVRAAASARNCMHGAIINTPPAELQPIQDSTSSTTPTLIRILYGERHRAHHVRDFITSHPRITIPLLVALLGFISYSIFDPIREFFIKSHVQGTFDTNKWILISWLKKETLGRLGLSHQNQFDLNLNSITGIEKQRAQAKVQLENWLKDVPDTFIVLTGPKGSGKTSLIKNVLQDKQNVLEMDCNQLIKNGRTDTKLVSELASATGYRPLFVLGSSINNMIDLASMGLIGQKAGFSSTLDSQLKSILEVCSSSLTKIAKEVRIKASINHQAVERARKNQATRQKVVQQIQNQGVKDGRIDAVAGNGAMSELGLGIERPSDDSPAVIVGPRSKATVRQLASGSTDIVESVPALPIVVLRGFATKGESKHEVLWQSLSEWAATLVENQVAHVIFVSDSATVPKMLARVLPNKPFNLLGLEDASHEASINWLSTKLGQLDKKLQTGSEPSVAKLGGRQTDLELLLQKVNAGFQVEEAVEDIVVRNAYEIRKSIFGDDENEAKSLKWSREQAWKLLVGLTKEDELKYADVLVNIFKSDESALRALESAEMISVQHRDSRPSVIKPGKPVYRHAFRCLMQDDVFRSSIEYQITTSAITSTTNELEKVSNQLIELSKLFNSSNGKFLGGNGATMPKEIETRVANLLSSMKDAQDKLDKLNVKKTELLKVLAEAE
ncbi:mitochondrial escape protein 2 [Microbotryomycetes sp. JL221]|nr:mitochondrial escape protein 2 [Microbotryomycetes sp. JL221]